MTRGSASSLEGVRRARRLSQHVDAPLSWQGAKWTEALQPVLLLAFDTGMRRD